MHPGPLSSSLSHPHSVTVGAVIAHRGRRAGAGLVVVVSTALAVVGPFRGGLPSLHSFPHPAILPIAVAVVAVAVSYLSAAAGLRAAAGQALPLGATVLVQLAAALANRLIPAGVGGTAVNLRYLRRAGVPPPQASVAVAAVALANALTGALCFALVFPWVAADGLIPHPRTVVVAAVLAAAAAASAILLVRRRLPASARAWLGQAGGVASALRRDRRRLGVVLAGSLGVKCAQILALLAALQAFGSQITPPLVVAVYLTGSAAAAAVPTPNGLGTVEAALVAGLVAVGGSLSIVLAGVLTFRLASFWLPIVPGIGASWLLRRRCAL